MDFRILESGYDAKDGLFVVIVLCLTIVVYSVLCIIVNTFHLLYLKRVTNNYRKEKVLPDSKTVKGEKVVYERDEDTDSSTHNIYARKKKLF